MTRQVIKDLWIEMNEPLEGLLTYLYADVLNLITTGMGNLVDPVSTAMGLPFVFPDGRAARGDEIAAAWWRVKNDPLSRVRGHLYAKTLTEIRLTPEGVRTLIGRKLDQNDAVLASRLPMWNDMPACAQMAMHSLAWACGPGAHFPRLFSAVNVHDYDAAAVEIHMNEWSGTVHNKGLIPRNVANKILMKNAARVETYHLDPDYINWKSVLASSTMPPADAPEHMRMLVTDPQPGATEVLADWLEENVPQVVTEFPHENATFVEENEASRPTTGPSGLTKKQNQ